jgi:diguanylate cyclase (GGDEF)-like protein
MKAMIMTKQTQLRIIVIDDNPAIYNDFKKILTPEQSGKRFVKLNKLLFGNETDISTLDLPKFQIDTASQGQEGVELIKKASASQDPYILAFVDIRMPPGWDGIETIKHIWEVDKDMQVVICTAYSDYSWEETIANLGMNDNLLILKKPFDSVAVRQLTYALTKKWQLMQDVRSHMNFLEKKVLEKTESLQHSLSLTRATLESSNNGIIVVDNDQKVVDYNSNFIDLWEIPHTLIESKNYDQIQEMMLSKLSEQTPFMRFINNFKEVPEVTDVIVIKLADGRAVECYSQTQKLNDRSVGRVWSFQDITHRIEMEAKLKYQATHDALTALPNRLFLLDRIKQGIAHASRHKAMFSVMFIDLDRFKLINDSFSHETGDFFLKTVSRRLSDVCRQEDTIARLSGDEFILISLSESISKTEDIIKIAIRTLNAINQSIRVNDRDITITASIGISIYPQDGTYPEQLLCNADLAMYRAKSLGGNQFQFYTTELNEQSLLRIEQESELRSALSNDEFFLEYQPQYDVKQNILVGVEALIRWNHPEKGLLSPIDFIPLAEDTGLIVQIGEWVLRSACAQNKAWQDKGFSPFLVAVNVSTKQFMQPNLVQTIDSILKETGLKAEYLEIEITENVIISNMNVIDTVNELKKLGVKIVLDDFGTGNSGLSYLRNLPIDRLKIDKSFIDNIDVNRSDEVIIKAIIAMANSLYLDILAEGVEKEEQITFLESENCARFQGFYFSKPIDVTQMEHLLTQLSDDN